MMWQKLVVLGAAAVLAACSTTNNLSGGWPLEPHPIPRPVKQTETHYSSPDARAASRFLQQATFGPGMAEINALTRTGYSAWLDAQFHTPQTWILPNVESNISKLEPGKKLNQEHFFRSFWKVSATAPDQLRQRVAFALSEIFVVSFEGMLDDKIRAVASYYDLLGRNAFGDFRTLLEEVSRHPAMGIYLSHMKNQKEDPTKNRVPDENYAREVMQLFSIGLYELNLDGTLKLKNGQPIETYDNDDITGLAKVFTGFSHGGGGFGYADDSFFNRRETNWEVFPMKGYPQFHSTSKKEFLGLTIPPQSSADPDASLSAALDHLFKHPNVGPFFGKQLIQRLVTSNPSPAYIRRVAQAFDDNGVGVRGDMQAVIRAVLLDPEARAPANAVRADFGKVREPILRLSQWMRAFHASSASGEFQMFNTDNPGTSLGQSPMRSPTVFNFYRPGYVPPGTQIAKTNMVAPEMQIVSENSVAGYANFMQSTIEVGAGRSNNGKRDIQPDYNEAIALADAPEKLLDYLDLLLTAGQLSPISRVRIVEAIASIPMPKNPANTGDARRNRVRLGILLTMVSPEYLIEK